MNRESTDQPSSAPRRFSWSLLFRVAVTLSLMTYLAYRADRSAVATAVVRVNWLGWFVGWLTFLSSQLVSARRWAGLARAVGLMGRYRDFVRRYFEGMFFNLCLPTAIGGDVVKAVRLGTTGAERLLAGFTVLVDRLCGLTALLTIGSMAFLYRALRPSLPAFIGACALAVAGVMLLVWLGLVVLSRLAGSVKRWPAIDRPLAALHPYYRKPQVIQRAVAWSGLVQMLNVLAVLQIGRAMGLTLPSAAYFITVPLVAMLTMLPSIGGLGLRETGMPALLGTLYGLPREEGIALAVLWSLIAMASGLLGGLVYLIFDRPSSPPPSASETNR